MRYLCFLCLDGRGPRQRKKSDLRASVAVLCFLPCVISTMASHPICTLFSIRTCQAAFVNRGRNSPYFSFRALSTRFQTRESFRQASESPRDGWNNSSSFALSFTLPWRFFFFCFHSTRFFSLWQHVLSSGMFGSARSFRGETRRVAFFIWPNPPSLTQCTVSLSSPLKSLPFSSRRDVYERRFKSSGFTVILPCLRASRCSYSAIPAFIALRIGISSYPPCVRTLRLAQISLWFLRREIPVDMVGKWPR